VAESRPAGRWHRRAQHRRGPQGGHSRVVLSTLDLHSVLDRWCERVVTPRWQGAADRMRSRDAFVGCFQDQADAPRFQPGLGQRRAPFAVAREPKKTRLGAFGRVAERQATRPGTRREPFTCLGGTLYGTRHRRGTFTVGWRADQARRRRRRAKRPQVRQLMRHAPLTEHAAQPHQSRRGHKASYGIAGHRGRRRRVDRSIERYGRKLLRSRRQKAQVRWEVCWALKRTDPLQRPKLSLP
jgi:RNA-directed DNA polymerase